MDTLNLGEMTETKKVVEIVKEARGVVMRALEANGCKKANRNMANAGFEYILKRLGVET